MEESVINSNFSLLVPNGTAFNLVMSIGRLRNHDGKGNGRLDYQPLFGKVSALLLRRRVDLTRESGGNRA